MRYTPSPMRVITSSKDLISACEDLATAGYVAVDTEFMREQTYWPQLCLIQLANPDHELIVDPLSAGLDLKPFFELMANPRVVKVFHAARQDIEIVVVLAGIVPQPIFDTQVAAMVCGFGESVSYVNLVKKITNRDLDKSSRFTDWSRRPLTQKQLSYALGDVTHLRDIYQFLKAEIDAADRLSWLKEEMNSLTDPATYRTEPDEAWKRLKLRAKNRKAFGILFELAAWRERVAQKQNVPRGRVLRDEALYDIANQAPETPEQLSGLRSLSEGFARSARARDIVDSVRRGMARDPATLPQLAHGKPLSPRVTATVELLKVLLKACAARHRVAPRLIASSDDLESIAAGRTDGIAALRGWRRQLFGDDALKLKRGDLALTIDGGEVKSVPSEHVAGCAQNTAMTD